MLPPNLFPLPKSTVGYSAPKRQAPHPITPFEEPLPLNGYHQSYRAFVQARSQTTSTLSFKICFPFVFQLVFQARSLKRSCLLFSNLFAEPGSGAQESINRVSHRAAATMSTPMLSSIPQSRHTVKSPNSSADKSAIKSTPGGYSTPQRRRFRGFEASGSTPSTLLARMGGNLHLDNGMSHFLTIACSRDLLV